MKKWIMGAILQLACLPAVYGLYSGNPADPVLGNGSTFFNCENSWWNPKIGYQRDYISDRKLKSGGLPHSRIDRFEVITDQGTIAWDFCQRFEIYGSVGSAHLDMDNRPFTPFLGVDDEFPANWHTNDGTIWSVGGKIILWDWCNTLVGVSGAYSQWRAHFTSDSVETFATPSSKLSYNEWIATIGAAYNFCYAVPYINLTFSGLTNSRVHGVAATSGLGYSRFSLKARDVCGLAIGTSITPVDSFYVTVEARLINEKSLTLQGQIRF